MAMVQPNIVIFWLIYYLFALADIGYIREDTVLKAWHNSKLCQGQDQDKMERAQPDIVLFKWFFSLFSRADKGSFL